MHLLALPLLFGAAQALVVPPPPGPYAVAVKHIELVDPSRIDPFAPEANTKRRIMVSAYLPVDAQYGCKAQDVPYMPPLTASVFGKMGESLGVPQGILEQFEMEFCDISTVNLNGSCRAREEFPVVVFSPGFQGTRLIYGALARSLANLEYVVVTIDHTYETLVVEFPDGSVEYAANSSGNGTLTLLQLEVRTGDESFLISQLSNTTVTDSLFANFPGNFNPHKVVVYGHSFGGSTAAVTAQRDPRVIGGLNFDGLIYGPVGRQGFKDKPFVLVGRDNSATPVPEWNEFYKKIDAAKMELAVRDVQHYAFMDVLLLLTVYQVPPESQPTVDQVFGKLNGKKVEKAVNEIMVGLLEFLFKNQTKLLKNAGRNPDIDVLLSDLPKSK